MKVLPAHCARHHVAVWPPVPSRSALDSNPNPKFAPTVFACDTCVVADIDYRKLAMLASREAFVAQCSFPFLVGQSELRRFARPNPTYIFGVPTFPELETRSGVAPIEGDDDATESGDPVAVPVAEPAVCAVRKIQDSFADMITVGRTNNNDVVLPDISVSKFHAYFRDGQHDLILCDAGSRNGTFVDGQRLAPRKTQSVACGASLRFGKAEFALLDAAATWDALTQTKGR